MPHIVIDYSANLDEVIASIRLVEVIHQAAIDTRAFPTWGIRTYARATEQFRVAGDDAAGFIQISIRIAPGRDLPTKQRIARELFDAITKPLEPIFRERRLGCQLEIQEYDPDVTLKRNNFAHNV